MEKIPEINYITPTDVIRKYPELKRKHCWTPAMIGSFLKCDLLNGYYDRNRRTSMIDTASVLELISFINNKIESQKIKL